MSVYQVFEGGPIRAGNGGNGKLGLFGGRGGRGGGVGNNNAGLSRQVFASDIASGNGGLGGGDGGDIGSGNVFTTTEPVVLESQRILEAYRDYVPNVHSDRRPPSQPSAEPISTRNTVVSPSNDEDANGEATGSESNPAPGPVDDTVDRDQAPTPGTRF